MKFKEQSFKIVCRLIGVLLILSPFLPIRSFFNFETRRPTLKDIEYIEPYVWVYSLLIFFGFTFCLSIITRQVPKRAQFFQKNLFHMIEKRFFPILFLCLACQLFFIAYYCFQFYPHVIDSIVQLFQANVFLSGQIVAKKSDLLQFFVNQNFVYTDTIWAAQYPPGHALMLAVGIFLGHQWLFPFAASLASFFFIYKITELLYSKNIARIASVLLLCSPFFVALGASYMNHTTALCFCSAFVYFFLRWEKSEKQIWFYLAAIAIAMAFIARPFSSFLIGIPFLFRTISSTLGSKRVPVFFVGGAFFAGFTALWPLFNKASTGSFLLTGYTKNWGLLHGLGFHESPWGHSFTLADGLINQLLNLLASNLFLFDSLIPAFLPLGIWCLFSKKIVKADKYLLGSFLFYIFGYVFYWHTDFSIGPRFWYEALLFIIPLTARSLYAVYLFMKDKEFLTQPGQRLMNSAIMVLFVAFIFHGAPHRFGIYAQRFPSFRVDLSSFLEQLDERKKIIFVKVSWGNRVIAKLRGKGVSANVVEKGYQKIGLCVLDTIAEMKISSGELEDVIRKEISKNRPFIKTSLNKDGSTKFYLPVNLSEKCEDEFNYDRHSPYTLYAPHFLLNQVEIRQDDALIVVRDLREQNNELLSNYPNHDSYLFNGKVITKQTPNLSSFSSSIQRDEHS